MPKLHLMPDIPGSKLERVPVELGEGEQVLVLYDETTFGSGKAGFAITTERLIEFDGKQFESTAMRNIVRAKLAQLELSRHSLAVERRVGEPIREVVYMLPGEREAFKELCTERFPGQFEVLSFEEARGDEALWRTRVYRGSGGMTLATLSSIEGRRIKEHQGVVAGEAILGAHFFKDLSAGVTDLVGGRGSAYEIELARARKLALRVMEDAARRAGANAIVGIRIDVEPVGSTMMMVCATGTAVTIE